MKTSLLFALLIVTFQAYSQKVFNVAKDSTITPQITFLEVSDSTLSDILICRVDSANKVYKDGLWFELSYPDDSYFNYSLSTDTSNYDIKIYFVTKPINAGWINRNKRIIYINRND